MSETRSSRGRFAWMAAALILAVIAGLSWRHLMRVEKLVSTYRDQYQMIQGQMNYLLENLAEQARERQGLASWEVEELREKGLTDPATDIAADLAARKDLVPFEGVLGGTMEFRDIEILTSRWVLGYVEDGHLTGHVLLEYEVSGDGKISWKLLRAYMD
jgi:hypothetical protein